MATDCKFSREKQASSPEDIDSLLTFLLSKHSAGEGRWADIVKEFNDCALEPKSKHWLRNKAKKLTTNLPEANTDGTELKQACSHEPTGTVAKQLRREIVDLSHAPPIELKPVCNKGIGVVASAGIPMGSIIFSEVPALFVAEAVNDEFMKTLSPDVRPNSEELHQKRLEFLEPILEKQFVVLPQEKQLEVLSLTDAFSVGTKTLAGIFCTNSIGGGSRGRNSLLCPSLARMNCSCRPNAVCTFAEGGDTRVQVLRCIEAGEEICIFYGNNLLAMTAERQRMLLTRWKFSCKCEACADSESDRRRQQIMQISRDLHAGSYTDYKAAYTLAKKAVKLHTTEHTQWSGYLQAVHHCMQFSAAACAPPKETQNWAGKAAEWSWLFHSTDAELCEQYDRFARDPSLVLQELS